MSSSALQMLLLLLALWVIPASSHRLISQRTGRQCPCHGARKRVPLSSEATKTRILCWVNTYHANHDKRLHAIKRTWGRKCDKLLFMSDIEDLSVPTVQIVAPPLHETLWQKHREIVRLLVREYSEDQFDWVFKCDDDTFLIMENLKTYLNTPEIRAVSEDGPMLKVKQETKKDGGLLYTPGGGGYAMNWAYLKKLEAAFDEPFCLPNEVVPDDWAISFCMRHFGVIPLDTRDEKRERGSISMIPMICTRDRMMKRPMITRSSHRFTRRTTGSRITMALDGKTERTAAPRLD
ncbi:Fringe-like [Phytophthora cactorum]|nr:Fringe-like [Phytophthora cactorum]